MSDITVHEQYPIACTEKEVTEGEKPTPNERQQSKIIAVILRKDESLIGQLSVQLRSGEREEYLRRVFQGIIGEKEYSGLLSSIRSPISYEKDERNPETLFGRISKDRQMRGIVAYFVRGDLQARDRLAPQDVYKFIRQIFPSVLDYENALGNFLDRIEKFNDNQKRFEYERSAKELGRIIYGKQWEYLEQIRLLEEEAIARQPRIAPEIPQRSVLGNGFEQTYQFN